MKIRLRCWLAALDVAFFIGRLYEPQWLLRLRLWLISKASDATDWGEIERRSGG
ncbi:hypothetical protein [Microbacterium sp.]|uniref:hypothetical protein n=1 Tax=Microbacterium sp. TaxID=51671 RepID=UPI002E37AD62|nr:hypothetical protein [Microbacterium sp.]HEX5728477.1 hypothetical protein [Microbacterium sp.]